MNIMKSKSLRLGVNIDHVATVRQARGGQQPDLLKAAHAAIKGGADILTVHLREDRRHIQDTDVYMLMESIDTPLNLELAATSEMVNIACSLEPWACCLVPERRAEVTTEGGLDVIGLAKQLKPVIEALQDKSIEVSVFLDPDNKQIKVAQELGISTIELHTGKYSLQTSEASISQSLNQLTESANFANQLGMHVHAGHGLNYENVFAVASLEIIEELNIGHSIIAAALFEGLENAVSRMRKKLSAARE
jgi:pyridoxine 5-phosphate synthase